MQANNSREENEKGFVEKFKIKIYYNYFTQNQIFAVSMFSCSGRLKLLKSAFKAYIILYFVRFFYESAQLCQLYWFQPEMMNTNGKVHELLFEFVSDDLFLCNAQRFHYQNISFNAKACAFHLTSICQRLQAFYRCLVLFCLIAFTITQTCGCRGSRRIYVQSHDVKLKFNCYKVDAMCSTDRHWAWSIFCQLKAFNVKLFIIANAL